MHVDPDEELLVGGEAVHDEDGLALGVAGDHQAAVGRAHHALGPTGGVGVTAEKGVQVCKKLSGTERMVMIGHLP